MSKYFSEYELQLFAGFIFEVLFVFFLLLFAKLLFTPAASQTVQVFPVDGRSGGSPLVQRDQRVEVEDFRPWT